MTTLPPDLAVKEEIRRQRDMLWQERWGRLPLTVLALALTTIYVPLWFAALCAVVDVSGELISMHYMRALDPKRHPRRYRFVIACTVVLQFAFVLPCAIILQLDDNFAKAFAVGMTMTTLMQLISARTIHMPFGIAGLITVSVTILVGNAVFWLGRGDMMGLVLSSLGAVGGISYTLIAMISNNRLHRTAALDRKAAEASNRAKSRFLAQMSHELRTPLNAILGMGHAEQRRNKDTLSQNRLSVLIVAAEGLSTILDDILDMSAIEAGRLPIRPQQVSPRAEIDATLALFHPGISEAGLRLTQSIDPQLDADWMLDPQRLRQCMSNLLSNALKNTEHGCIHVAARLIDRAGDAPMLRIEITDTGPGIPSHLHRLVFEPFSQARKPQAVAESNGLGLSICRTMAREMGGDLTIKPNTAGQRGACFVLSLQLGAATEPAAKAVPKPSPIAKQATETTVGLKVLVIDDIATNRLVASTYLRMLGATMIEAESGAQALDLLARLQPDLVLLDMNMPEMNGLETLAKIRALPGPLAKLPVIAMTADAMAEHRAHYMASGVDGYLAKPINPARIAAEIIAVLDKSRETPSD